MSVKEMMTTLELKHRPNFMAQLLSPAINMGLVRMKYPDSPRHSKQRYLLTVRGLILIDNLDAQKRYTLYKKAKKSAGLCARLICI